MSKYEAQLSQCVTDQGRERSTGKLCGGEVNGYAIQH